MAGLYPRAAEQRAFPQASPSNVKAWLYISVKFDF